jgi:hypothetical protein
MKKGVFMFWVNEGLTPEHFVNVRCFHVTLGSDATLSDFWHHAL